MQQSLRPTKRISARELEAFFVQAVKGNAEAKERIFEFLRTRLLILARYRVPEAAEDTVQEALVVIHTRFSELETLEGLIAFANRVLRNKIGNVYQGRYKQRHTDLDSVEHWYYTDADIESNEMDRILRQSIEKLGESHPACRDIFSCLYRGLEASEISDQLGISKSMLKVRTFRCRVALRRVLSTEFGLQI